jgi:hypothetical protein
MANNLLTPILNDRLVSVNFFNGRILSGEDLTAEHNVNRVAQSLLGQAVGSGVAYGLEVSESAKSTTIPPNPVLSVKAGLALNRNGGALLLDKDTEISLMRPDTNTGGATLIVKSFQPCTPPEAGAYIAGAGVYLLTVCPASGTQGLAEVSGISTAAAPCNSKYRKDGVQFRLLQIDLTLTELDDVNHLQNLVAYKFFGVTDWAQLATDPFGTPPASFGLIDQLRAQNQITDCEVPLAVLYWTATGGLVWVDMWSVRRLIIPQDTSAPWMPLVGRRRWMEGLAVFRQFQGQVSDIVESGVGGAPLTSIIATDYFQYLPAAGFIPIGNINPLGGFDYLQFFKNRTYRSPVFMEGAKLELLVHTSFLFPPIDLNKQELLWVYQIRENQETIDNSTTNALSLYMLFSNGQMSYQGVAKYDLNYWNYANYV